MADATLSGYKSAAVSVAWASGQTLDSLTDNEYTDLSDAIDNSSDLYLFADIEIVLGSAAFTGSDSAIEVYIIPSVDGTNYANWAGNGTSDEQENDTHYVGIVSTSGSTSGQRLVLMNIVLPNGLYKYAFRNRGNVTLASSGNTVKWRPHNYASA